MSYLKSILILCPVVWVSGCDGGGDRFLDGNKDPEYATCDTVGVMSCTNDYGICHQWYSDVAANAILYACQDLGDDVWWGPCAAQYNRCCLHLDGSNDYPELICTSLAASNPMTEAECDGEGHTYCEY
jgi:hypothetical protein